MPLLRNNWAFFGRRIYRLAQNRSYIYLPFLISLVVAVRRHDWLLALGALAGLPGCYWHWLRVRLEPAS